jgi:putative lipoprotein
MRSGFRLALAFVALLVSAMPALAEKLTLSGEVTYRERIALPPGATLSIGLVDLAAPTTPRIAARAALASPGQVPLNFNLNFDDTVLTAGASYGLVAEIAGEDGAVWFRNPEPYAVDPRVPAGSILIVVTFTGQTEATAPAMPETPAILDVTWVAATIGGNPVAPNIQSSLSIAPDMRAGGRGGCNSWFAQAELTPELGDGTLVFSAVAATRMACLSEAATAQETAWFAALAATRSYRLDGDRLVLLDEARTELATLSPSRF